jgi:hypothetical protein
VRISVSDLESFRRYRTDEDFPLHVLLRQLRREEPPSDKMIAGTALHHLLETAADDTTLDRVEIDSHVFRFTCEGELRLSPIREMRGTRTYHVDGEAVTLSGRVDEIDGTHIVDHKLTSNFDATRYLDSYQWRAYLSIFRASKFTYNIFVGARNNKNPEEIEWEIKEFHPLTFYRYPELDADLVSEIGRYLEFARLHLAA